MRLSQLARAATAAGLVAATALSLPALADPGNGQGKGHAYGHEKPKGPKDVPTSSGCTGDPDDVSTLRYPSGGQTAQAVYALPAGKPKGIVVFDHGYSHTMYSWVEHVRRTARTLGVIAVAPDYRGQVDDLTTKPLPSSRGWRVAEGAVDTNAVAKLFDGLCLKGKGHNVLYSVSMGGNTAGLALAAQPKRVNGQPMFDEWVDVEGAANVTETYLGARVLTPANTFAAHATEDIEQEMGGPVETASASFASHTVVNRVPEIVASGVKGVVMVHGYVDGLVTHDISRQLQAELRARNVPVDFRSFLTHSAGSESGTTLDGYLPTGLDSPFAGHASETSTTHDVGVAGFTALAELYHGMHVSCRDSVSDGRTGRNDTVSDGCA